MMPYGEWKGENNPKSLLLIIVAGLGTGVIMKAAKMVCVALLEQRLLRTQWSGHILVT